MAVTNFSPFLGLALPTTGDLSGTWGATVNTSITDLIDSAIAGTTTITTDANYPLSTTNGAANEAREAIILCTGARTAIRTITAPAQSKTYIVINATTGSPAQSIQFIGSGSGPTTGVTVPNGYKVLIAWNALTLDFVKVASSVINLASEVTGTLPVANGGTGQTTYTDGQLLIGNTTGNTLTKATLTAGSNVTITNSAGAITIASTGSGGSLPSQTGNSGKYLTTDGVNPSWAVVANDITQTLVDGATVNWNTSLGNIATLTLGGNRIIAAPTNMSAQTYILVLNQDATGNRTVTWNAVFKWPGGALPVLSTAANAKDIFSFFSDGTNMYGTYLRGVA
jgi:hypothetical protein